MRLVPRLIYLIQSAYNSPHFRKDMYFVLSFSVNDVSKDNGGPVHVHWEDFTTSTYF